MLLFVLLLVLLVGLKAGSVNPVDGVDTVHVFLYEVVSQSPNYVQPQGHEIFPVRAS